MLGNTTDYRIIVLTSTSKYDKKEPKTLECLKNNLCTCCLWGLPSEEKKHFTVANVGCLVHGKLQNCFPYTQVLKP